MSIFLQVGQIKVTAKKAGFENSEDINCQNFALKMTNGKRNVRLGVDIFDKRILDFCKFILDTVLQNMASSTAIFSLQRTKLLRMNILLKFSLESETL